MKKLLNNKKAQWQAAIIVPIAIALVMIIALIAFLASGTLRWVLIGVAMLIAVVWLLGQSFKSEKGINKRSGTIMLVLLAIGLLLIFGSSVLQTAFGGGLTVLSMSPTSVISSNTNLQGVWWLVNTQTSGGQSISGTLTPDQARVIDGGYLTKNPLSLTVSAVNENINYNIQNTGQQLYKYQMYVTKSPRDCLNMALFGSTDAPACNAGDYQDPIQTGGIIFGWFNYVCQRNCIHAVPTGVVGNINPDRVSHSAIISLQNGQETITKTVTSDLSSADFVNNAGQTIGHVDYTSALWTGNFPPSTANLKAFYNVFNSRWSITSDQKITDYSTQKQTFENFASQAGVVVDQLVFPTGSTAQQKLDIINKFIQDKIDVVNTYEQRIESDDLSITTGQTWQNRGDQNSGKVVINNPVQIANMNLLFRIRADWLGIVINNGKPVITSLSTCDFKSGDIGTVGVTVQNQGSSTGNFKATISCPTIKQTYSTSSQVFAVNEQKVMNINIDANVASELTETCSVTVFDTNVASNTVTSPLSCKVEAPATCQVGTANIVGSCVKGCDNVTGTVKNLFCCDPATQTIQRDLSKVNDESGGYYCQSKGNATSCSIFQEPYTAQSTDYGFLGWRYLFNNPINTTTSGCKTAGWVNWLIIGGVVVILGTTLIVMWKPARRKTRRYKR